MHGWFFMSKILLVEDEFLILETTKELLELLGHNVTAVLTGADTLMALAKENGGFDLVILDLSLPDIDGRQLLLQLGRDFPQINIVICSGSQPGIGEFANSPNVKAVLAKPFGVGDLKNVVSQALERAD